MTTHPEVEKIVEEFTSKFVGNVALDIVPLTRASEFRDFLRTKLPSLISRIEEAKVNSILKEAKYVADKYIESETGKVHFLTKIKALSNPPTHE